MEWKAWSTLSHELHQCLPRYSLFLPRLLPRKTGGSLGTWLYLGTQPRTQAPHSGAGVFEGERPPPPPQLDWVSPLHSSIV